MYTTSAVGCLFHLFAAKPTPNSSVRVNKRKCQLKTTHADMELCD